MLRSSASAISVRCTPPAWLNLVLRCWGSTRMPSGSRTWVGAKRHSSSPGPLVSDRLVVGVSSAWADDTLCSVYAPLIDAGTTYIRTDLGTAELAKVSANAFLATKISFINAMADLCEAAGADVVTLAEVLGYDARIASGGLAAGLGFGGGCLPKDLRALLARAAELGVSRSLAVLHAAELG